MILKKKKSKRSDIDHRITQYIDSVLKHQFKPFTSGVAKTSKIESGENTTIRMVENAHGDRFVIRFFHYERHKEKALEHCYVAGQFRQCGINTPIRKNLFKNI